MRFLIRWNIPKLWNHVGRILNRRNWQYNDRWYEKHLWRHSRIPQSISLVLASQFRNDQTETKTRKLEGRTNAIISKSVEVKEKQDLENPAKNLKIQVSNWWINPTKCKMKKKMVGDAFERPEAKWWRGRAQQRRGVLRWREVQRWRWKLCPSNRSNFHPSLSVPSSSIILQFIISTACKWFVILNPAIVPHLIFSPAPK